MVERDRRNDKSEPAPTQYGLLDGLTIVFAVAAFLGLFFYFSRPAENQAVVWFRLGMAVFGSIGLVAVSVLKMSRSRRS
ncbi:MAG TPA: hypothetical protein VKD71_14110 [Gemmataceae bacterium]|nr:hypothetical protein [Gemmataceae bacterium]